MPRAKMRTLPYITGTGCERSAAMFARDRAAVKETPMTRSVVPPEVLDVNHAGENQLLAALPPDSRRALQPYLEHVSCGLKDIVYRPNEPIAHVLFPCSGVFSLLAVGDDDGELIEVGTVGKEGFVGLPLFL